MPDPTPDLAAPAIIRQRQARVATAAAFAAQGLLFTVLITHLPQFSDRHDLSEGTVTLIILMVIVLAGVGSLLSELLAAATSSRTALRCGLLVIAGAAAGVGLAPEILWFVLAFAVYGLGLGAVDAAGNMQGVTVQHRYGRSIITSFHAAWSAAAILGALYVTAGEHYSMSLGWSILPVSLVVLLIAAVAGPLLLPPETSAPSAVSDPVASAVATPTVSSPSGKSLPSTSGPLLLLGLAMTCFWAVDAGVSNWSTLYLRDLLHAGDSAALGYAAYQATALISRLAGDFAVRRLGAVTTVQVGSVIGTIGTVLVVLAPGPVVAVLGFGLAGLGLPVIAPLCFSAAGAAARNPDPTDPGRLAVEDAVVDSVVARLNVFNYLGSLLGAVVVGGVASAADLRIGFIVPVLLAGSCFALARAFAPAEKA